jgi:hypothetical protein
VAARFWLNTYTAPRHATEIKMIPPKMPTAIIKVLLLFDSSGSGASPKSSVLVVSSKDIKHSPGYFSLLFAHDPECLVISWGVAEFYNNNSDIIPQLQGL